MELPPEGVATSILTLEADSNAPNNLILNPTLCRQVEGFLGAYGTYLGFNILVFPTTPSYVFYIFAGELPTPSEPPLTNETTPPPFPTPFPTPKPWTPPPWEPEIQVEKGGEARILFYIYSEFKNPSLTLNLTCNSSPLPEEIKAEITREPLKTTIPYSSLLLTLVIDPTIPEGTYHITAKGSVNQITYERVFNLRVTSS